MKYSHSIRQIIYCSLFSFLFISCVDNSGSEKIKEAITSAQAIDIGNLQTSSDIFIRFAYDEEAVDEIRIVLVPQTASDSFDKEAAESVPSSSYQSINATTGNFEGQLNSDLLDVNGTTLLNGTTYEVMFLLVLDGSLSVSQKSATLEMTDLHPLIGRYRGTWNDNIYINFPLTVKVNSYFDGDSSLNGESFYTNDFTPCCNGAQAGAKNDGRITLELNEENNQIDYFRYDQVLLTFMGGCSGLYEGQGSYETLEINITFTGDDCEGFHSGGRIKLSRIF